MNTYLSLAAGLIAVAGVLHSILGERLIFSKLARGGLPETLASPEFAFRTLRLFWHLVSVAWWGFTALLIALASTPVSDSSRVLLWAMAITFLASTVVSLAISRGKHFSWGLLLSIAAVIWLGVR